MTLFMLIAIELEFDTLKSSNYVSIIQLLGVLANRHLPLLLIAAVVPIRYKKKGQTPQLVFYSV